MTRINLDDLQPGMVLASDVVARNGRTLLRSGSQVTEKHIGIFKAWGVTEAKVQGITKEEVVSAAAKQFDPELLEKAKAEAEKRFRHTDPEHPFIQELKNLCTFRIAQALEEEGS